MIFPFCGIYRYMLYKESVPTHPAKRAFDVTLSLIVLALLSPLILLFLLLIFIEHLLRGRPLDPLFYTEQRWSEGQSFQLIKFNIFRHEKVLRMRARGEFIQTKDLERNGDVLFVGLILKQIYLDELPQTINVLRGDMSIVGPRPMNDEVHFELLEVGNLDKEYIRAGITGYYQAVHKVRRMGGTQEKLDRAYVEFCRTHNWHQILYFDIRILLRTLKVLILARGI